MMKKREKGAKSALTCAAKKTETVENEQQAVGARTKNGAKQGGEWGACDGCALQGRRSRWFGREFECVGRCVGAGVCCNMCKAITVCAAALRI